MKNYKLLTPGPLTTTESVKKEMLFDHCTWDDDYKAITLDIRRKLLELAHVSEEEYTVVLMQGSGTFGVESVLTSVVGKDEKLLIIANGAYGERMEEIAVHAGLSYQIYHEVYYKVPDAERVAAILDEHLEITHVSMVHSETTSGILNDIEAVAGVVKERGKTMIVDAMSSFGGVEIPVKDWGIDFLISSANKCIQGVPGFSFIIADKQKLIASKGKARSLSLDLYDQWETMNKDGKWRFTSPTHVVLAFAQALKEMEAEGGIPARCKRYTDNNRLLIKKMGEYGIRPYIDAKHQGPIITTFFYPENHTFSFQEMYTYIKDRGYAIYPGKVTEAETFRIGNIGEIYEEDILKLTEILGEFLEKTENGKKSASEERKKMRKWEAVIFDWAGTTVDYGCFAPVRAFLEVFRHFGIEPTIDEVRKPMGVLKREHIRIMLMMPRLRKLWQEKYKEAPTEKNVDELYDLFEEKLMSILGEYAKVKPYVTETVEALRAEGIKIGSTTGYTDEMMAIVVPKAKDGGYAPDVWFSPNAVGNCGRPYPYMIFKNMEALGVQSIENVIKVGDTVSDIKEGKNAGVYTVGVIEGSSELGLSEEEYRSLEEEVRKAKTEAVRKRFLEAGADAVILNLSELKNVMQA